MNVETKKAHSYSFAHAARLFLFVTVVCGGCASHSYKVKDPLIPRYALMVNERGQLLKTGTEEEVVQLPRTESANHHQKIQRFDRLNNDYKSDLTVPVPVEGKNVDEYFKGFVRHIREEFRNEISLVEGETKTQPLGDTSKLKLLIFVHGGLNDLPDALQRSEKLYKRIKEAGYYPVFINWNSAALSSYSEHLLFVRQGQFHTEWQPLLGRSVAPSFLLADFLRSAGRSYLSIAQLWQNDIEGSWMCPSLGPKICGYDPQKVGAHLKEMWPGFIPPKNPPVNPWAWIRVLSYLLTFPTKTATAPILDGAGGPAWDNMLRRTSVLFRTDSDFKQPIDGRISSHDEDDSKVQRDCAPVTSTKKEKEEEKRSGALARFFKVLKEDIENCPDVKWDITLIGHSMGAIVINEVLRDFGDDLPISNIVYMAAACSIRDYEDSVWPYLAKQIHEKELKQKCENVRKQSCEDIFPEKPPTQFFTLMLHPKAEALESAYIDLPPRGSLLVWLDGFLTNPATPLDRTLGRFTNFMLTAEKTPGSLRQRVHPTVFKMEEKYPRYHSDFAGHFNFWKSQCWELKEANSPVNEVLDIREQEESQLSKGYTLKDCWHEDET